MRLKFFILILFLFGLNFCSNAQKSKFSKLSCPEKWWVIWHPFVAKKAYNVSIKAREETERIKKDSVLIGTGNAQQIDAFRHAYWMANLFYEIGYRKAKKLGEAHEKGNYKDYKKHRNEDGVIPDKISSEMDLYNNKVGLEIAAITNYEKIKEAVIEAVKKGKCKMIRMDKEHNYLDCEGNIISDDALKGKWENNKCLVNSNEINF